MNNDVLTLEEIDSGIVKITMHDRLNKNTFSPELIAGLNNAFASVKDNERIKVVILTGYDNYFASGGTRESLLELHSTNAKFTDVNIYRLAMDCPIPVISAMQGHGIGGGFVMGLFADIIILSIESIYTTNFMKYGFTPGMGATCILPEKLGLPLAQEMLLTGKNYRGEELARRGIPFKVLPRKEILIYASNIAKELANKSRLSLIALKSHLNSAIQKKLPSYIEKEVNMHNETIHQAEVKDRIINLYLNQADNLK